MSHGKFSIGLVLLLISAAQLHAQWGSDSNTGSECQDIVVIVKDARGGAIMGASVTTDNDVPTTTGIDGTAEIPCRSFGTRPQALNVTASGYRPASVALLPDSLSHYEVMLDRNEPIHPSAGTTVSAAELSVDVQQKSAHLQDEANRALARQDYENAQKILLEALQLTPSAAAIANNLGVVALQHKDLESAGSWFKKAAEEAPRAPDILGNLGMIRWLQHRDDESYSVLTKAFSMGYQKDVGHYILGTLDLQKGESREAVNHLKKLSTDRFPYRDLYLSIALRNCGKTKAADESYRNFFRRHPAPYMVSMVSGLD